jgi:inosose dehydratase
MTENKLIIGTAPDSWGVWFADDPKQTPWERFLDEVAESGYKWIELGPYGYLPNDPARLAEELKQRDLKVTAGTVFTAFHRGLGPVGGRLGTGPQGGGTDGGHGR